MLPLSTINSPTINSDLGRGSGEPRPFCGDQTASEGQVGIVMKSVGRNLILTGAEGARRGTLYAVCEFLEREAGVLHGAAANKLTLARGGIRLHRYCSK